MLTHLPDPETAKFLTEKDRRTVLEHLPESAPNMKAKTVNMKQIKALLCDPTWVTFTILWMTHGIGGWGIQFVLPTVIYELGMTDTAISQLMSMVSSCSFLGFIPPF
jgi:hypothetical protein